MPAPSGSVACLGARDSCWRAHPHHLPWAPPEPGWAPPEAGWVPLLAKAVLPGPPPAGHSRAHASPSTSLHGNAGEAELAAQHAIRLNVVGWAPTEHHVRLQLHHLFHPTLVLECQRQAPSGSVACLGARDS